MATVNKNFVIKNGLIVQGSTATINGNTILTENAGDTYILNLVGGATLVKSVDSVFTVDQAGNLTLNYGSGLTKTSNNLVIDRTTVDTWYDAAGAAAAAQSAAEAYADALTTDDVAEGTTNKYFTDTRAKHAAANLIVNATKTNITISGDENGLTITAENGVADSTTDDLDEGLTNLYFTNTRARNAVSGGTGITYNSSTGEISVTSNTYDAYGAAAAAQSAAEAYADALTTDDVSEGSTNKYFTDTRARNSISSGTGITYNSSTGEISVTSNTYDAYGAAAAAQSAAESYADGLAVNYDPAGAASDVQDNLDTHTNATSAHGVTGDIVGTSDVQSLSNKTFLGQTNFQSGGGAGGTANHIDVDGNTGDMTITSGYDLNLTSQNNITVTTNTGDIILNPDGGAYIGSVSAGNEIATNSYVDNAVSGLDWKKAVNVLATSSVALSGSTPLTIDSHTLSDGYRVLLTAQSTNSENGIYDLAISGGSYTLTRSTDADAFGELIGAAVFVMEGTQYNNTSWVQSNHYLTDFTSQAWTQFSGSGSVVAGTGITVDGLEVSIDRTTVDTWYDAAGSAASAQSAAESYADSLAVNYDSAGSAVNAQSNAEAYADNIVASGNANAEPTYKGVKLGYYTELVSGWADTASGNSFVPLTWNTGYGTAKLTVHVRSGNHTQASEVLVARDSSNNLHITEYAIVTTNGALADITVSVSGSTVSLVVTPTAGHDVTEAVASGSVIAWAD
jgi:hypothetical protein